MLEFADGLYLVICNTLFINQQAKLLIYVVGSVKSTVDYIMLWQGDKAKVHHRQHSRASPVLTAIGLVNGKPWEPVIFDPPQNQHTLTDR